MEIRIFNLKLSCILLTFHRCILLTFLHLDFICCSHFIYLACWGSQPSGGNKDSCVIYVQLVQRGHFSKRMQYEAAQAELVKEQAGQLQDEAANKPRYSRVFYPHLEKTFYRKNLITRVILNSQQTNMLSLF